LAWLVGKNSGSSSSSPASAPPTDGSDG
jgi:hypothetical protein